MPRPKGLPKTGGRVKGQILGPKPIKLADTPENRALMLLAPTAEVRTPRAVMMDAMLMLDGLAKKHFEIQDYGPSLKYLQAAVAVADRVAPYIHARLLSVESRTEEKAAPFVVRAPAVMADSSAWQAAVGAAVIDMDAAQSPSAGRTEVSVHPAQQQAPEPQNAPPTAPVPLMNDPKTNRITVMRPGPRMVQPSGTEQWLASIQKKVG
jgi:hypothetical protein